ETITAFDGRIEAALEPFRQAIERLKEVPSLSETSAQVLLAEIGTDMRQFPTAGHLLSWAGLIPRLDESAGKRRSTRVRKGAPWLRGVCRLWGRGRGLERRPASLKGISPDKKHAAVKKKLLPPPRPRSCPPSTTCGPPPFATRFWGALLPPAVILAASWP